MTGLPDPVRVAIDTNVLVYSLDAGAPDRPDPRTAQARALLAQLRDNPAVQVVVPVQVSLELGHVLVRKLAWPAARYRDLLDALTQWIEFSATDLAACHAALELVATRKLQVFDAAIVSVAKAAGCSVLLSEDMQDRARYGTLTVLNPFLEANAATLGEILTTVH